MHKRRRDLTILDKLKLLEKYDALPPMSQHNAAKKLDISQPLLCKILKHREELEGVSLNNQNVSRKRNRTGKDEQVEAALIEWFQFAREKDARLSGPILREQAENLARKLGKEDFSATEGWFHRFTKRHNIVYKKSRCERRNADSPAAESWFKSEWPQLIDTYSPDDIYIADETGIYFRALPETSYLFKSEKNIGCEITKDRITVLCCASMTGKKEKLLVIGQSKNPKCFKNVKDLPVDYHANQNALMTSAIFEEWLISWDRRLDHNILLLIDNCTAHNVDASLKHIRIVFLPGNTTTITSPLDQGIIKTLKAYYRKDMRQHIIEKMTNIGGKTATELSRKTDLLTAIHILRNSWRQVTEPIIKNCFKKSGFTPKSEQIVIDCDLTIPEDMSPSQFEEWMSIDEDLQTTASVTSYHVCQEIFNSENCNLSSDDESSNENLVVPPSKKEITEALAIIRRAIQLGGTENDFEQHYVYEKMVHKVMNNSFNS